MTAAATATLTGLFVWTSLVNGLTGIADASTTPAVEIPPSPTYSVAMTAYNAVPEQTDGDPSITAAGLYSNPEIIAARSQDLADELPFGTVIEVQAASSSPKCGFDQVSDKIGLRVIGDTMNVRMHNKIDIMFPHMKTARTLGVCNKVTIKVVGFIDLKQIPESQNDLRLAMGYLPKAGDERLAVSK